MLGNSGGCREGTIILLKSGGCAVEGIEVVVLAMLVFLPCVLIVLMIGVDVVRSFFVVCPFVDIIDSVVDGVLFSRTAELHSHRYLT